MLYIEPQGNARHCMQITIYLLHSSHEEGTLANSGDAAAAPEYATLSKFQPAPVVAKPNQSYMALDRNW